MTAKIISGKDVARQIREEVAVRAAAVTETLGRPPGLDVVLVGDDPASHVYVGRKEKASAAVGIRNHTHRLAEDSSQDELMELVDRLNADDEVDGILVQLPLPPHMNEQAVIEAIAPDKDVDGFHPISVGRLMTGLPGLRPCTPAGVVELLRRSDVQVSGAHAVVVGRSNNVGKPLANLLLLKGLAGDATVTVCHSRTPDLAAHTRQADILVAAMGRPLAITAEMVKPGAVVIDVGIHRVEDATAPRGTRLVGDVDFDAVSEIASAITPVPGGVGPMTVAMLMFNTVAAAEARVAD
jgi:methylenetetrahydrofolate dehydrogenase (NADP+) / methenyltetrahydrofolate cyclohydrolase